ncbi:hypothetical protein D0B32_17540 [Paraburkholderia sp. DHOC27]|nr:hypothetical protein D0B32_17540 [Paraburkholderia sp. DHOC27]
MAIPRLRPLDRLPAPFGRDWALSPPHLSLRAELKALYAAVLRTFCVNTAAFRALCRWESRRASAPDDTAQVDASSREDVAADIPPSAPDFSAASATAPSYGASTRWTALAGGVCAVGGAALLAWLAIDHYALHRQSAQAAHEGRTANRSGLTGQARLRALPLAGSKPDDARTVTRSRAVPPVAVDMPVAPVAPVPREAEGTSAETLTRAVIAPASAPVTAGTSLTTQPEPVSSAPNTRAADADAAPGTTDEPHALRASPPASSSTRNHPDVSIGHSQPRKSSRAPGASHLAARNAAIDAPRSSHSVSSRASTANEDAAFKPRSLARPSAAGDFSPFAPSALGVDEYASVTMSANTHLRDIPPARALSHVVNTESTDWANRVSQRRITDVPEQFSK